MHDKMIYFAAFSYYIIRHYDIYDAATILLLYIMICFMMRKDFQPFAPHFLFFSRYFMALFFSFCRRFADIMPFHAFIYDAFLLLRYSRLHHHHRSRGAALLLTLLLLICCHALLPLWGAAIYAAALLLLLWYDAAFAATPAAFLRAPFHAKEDSFATRAMIWYIFAAKIYDMLFSPFLDIIIAISFFFAVFIFRYDYYRRALRRWKILFHDIIFFRFDIIFRDIMPCDAFSRARYFDMALAPVFLRQRFAPRDGVTEDMPSSSIYGDASPRHAISPAPEHIIIWWYYWWYLFFTLFIIFIIIYAAFHYIIFHMILLLFFLHALWYMLLFLWGFMRRVMPLIDVFHYYLCRRYYYMIYFRRPWYVPRGHYDIISFSLSFFIFHIIFRER